MPRSTTEVTTFHISVAGVESAFTCAEGERVLHAMERQGVRALPVGCRGGGCGTCRVHVTSGSYETKKMSRAHVSEADERAGYALACRLMPRSDLSLRLAAKPAVQPA